MTELTRLLVVSALTLATAPVFAMTSSDLALLKKELGSQISRDLVRDLKAENLLPASKIHDAVPIWNRDEALPDGGSVAIIAPTAARVGLELQRLRERGVSFTDTPTVQRFMRLKDSWLQLMTQPWFGGVVNAIGTAVHQRASRLSERPNRKTLDAVLRANTDLTRGTQLSELTADGLVPPPPMTMSRELAPGELKCYKIWYGEMWLDSYIC